MKQMTKFWRVYIKLRSLFIPDGPDGDAARGALLRPFLRSAGRNFKVASQAFIFNPNGLSVGDNVYIGFNTYLGQGDVTLEDEVLIGNFVSITASNHLMKDGSYRFGGFEPRPIRIGKGSWIAAHASILAGVTIGRSCLVAAGSVVTRSVPDHTTVAGVPAKPIQPSKKETSV